MVPKSEQKYDNFFKHYINKVYFNNTKEKKKWSIYRLEKTRKRNNPTLRTQ